MNKLTIEKLLSYRLSHPKGSLVDVARQHGVSKQYAWELWHKHFSDMDFNESWGIKIKQTCLVCKKTFYAYKKLTSKGFAKYCSQACYFKNQKPLDF